MKPAPQKSVSLEDLLRLKRAEQPSTEFWPQFERELRAKQLAALVVRRPWWRTLPGRAMVGLSRYHLPLGATAVLALTFLSVREYRTAAPGRGPAPILDEVPAMLAPEADSANVAAVLPPQADFRSEISPAVARGTTAPESAATAEVAGADSPAGGRNSVLAALTGLSTSTDDLSRPSERSIAQNFAAVQAGETTFGHHTLLGGATRGFESRVLPARAPVVEPLSQVTPPSDVRRARYLGTALPVVATAKQIVPRSSERLASRIADERLYESLGSRFGVGGDRVNVKF